MPIIFRRTRKGITCISHTEPFEQSYYVLSLGRLPGSLLANNIINGIMEMAIIPVALVTSKRWAKRSILASGFFISSGVILVICGLLEICETDYAQQGKSELFVK